MTERDPYVNMLRTAIAVAAAGLGGADAITVLAAYRAARPAGRIRAPRCPEHAACFIGRVEPRPRRRSGRGFRCARSHHRRAVQRGVVAFQDIEKSGGVWAALEAGIVQKNVAAVACRTAKSFCAAARTFYWHQRLSEHSRKPSGRSRRAPWYRPRRRTVPASRHCRAAAAHPAGRAVRKTSRRLRRNPRQDRRAAESFSGQSRHARGIHARAPVSPRIFSSQAASKRQAAMAMRRLICPLRSRPPGAAIVCLCSSDKVYEKEAIAAVEALKAAGARHIYFAGRPGEREAALRAAGRADLHLRRLRRRFRHCMRLTISYCCRPGDRKNGWHMSQIPNFAQRRLRRRALARPGASRAMADAGGHRGQGRLRRGRSRRHRRARYLSRHRALSARPLPDHVCHPAMDDPAICRLLHGGRFQCLLPAQSRRRPEGSFDRLRSRHPSRLRQRSSARLRRCRHGGRRDRIRSTTCARCSPAFRSTRCRCR